MKEHLLKPITDKDSYSKQVANEIMQHLEGFIFAPLFEILEDNIRWSSINLQKAFEKGRLRYDGEYVIGKFTAPLRLEIKRLGGVWNKTKLGYRLPLNNLPAGVRTAISLGKLKAKDQLHAVISTLEQLQTKKAPILSFGNQFDNTVDDLTKQVNKGIPSDLEIPMQLDAGATQKLREEYNLNLNLYVHDWTKEQIFRLREKVDKNVREGFRADNLLESIKSEFGISYNKAKFLARQETSLLVSRYRQERYTEAGMNEYIWSTSHDDRVRGRHRELDRKRFSWDSPPVVDTATGRKANPGEDFNCRCVAIPVLKSI